MAKWWLPDEVALHRRRAQDLGGQVRQEGPPRALQELEAESLRSAMLIVDAQIHLWKKQQAHQLRQPPPDHRLHRGRRAQGDGRRRRERGRSSIRRAGIPTPTRSPSRRAPRPIPVGSPSSAIFRSTSRRAAPRSTEMKGRPGVLGLRFALLQPASADVAHRWKPRLAVGGRGASAAAHRAARAWALPGHRPDRGAPSRAQADHRPLRSPRRGVVEPARPGRRGQASQRGPEGHGRAELLERALSAP